MEMFIAIMWYVLVFLAGPEALNSKKDASKEKSTKIEQVKTTKTDYQLPKESKVQVWEDSEEGSFKR